MAAGEMPSVPAPPPAPVPAARTATAPVPAAGADPDDEHPAPAPSLLDTVFHAAPVGLATFDLDARFTDVNATLVRIDGLSRERHLGRRVEDLLPDLCPDLDQQVFVGLAEVIREVGRSGRPVYGLEFSATTAGGPGTWKDSFFPVLGRGGVVTGVACLVEDVTEARRLEEEQAAARRRTALTTRASDLLSRSLEPTETLEHLCDLLVPAVGDHAVVDLREPGGELRRAALRHAAGMQLDPALNRPMGEPTGYPAGHPVRAAVDRDESLLVRDTARQTDLVPSGPDARFVEAAGICSVIVVPMTVAGRTLGVVSLLSSASGRHYDESDLALVQELVSRASVAVANALSYAEQRSAAVQLQRSMLPAALPSAETLEVAWRYAPGTDGTEVGGDWVDVIELKDGRVAFSVGDVMGRGLTAAAVMGQLRTAVRTLAMADPPPHEVLQRLDELLDQLPREQLVTCVYGVYDPARAEVCLSSAGHLPPLLATPEGARTVDVGDDLPLGVQPTVRHDVGLALPAGSVLALCTDGLVEARDKDLGQAIDAVARQLLPVTDDLERICDRVLEAAGRCDDDVALLLLRPQADPADSVVVQLPGTTAAAASAREELRQRLATWGLLDHRVVGGRLLDVLALVTTELVSNAARYADEVDLVLRRSRGAVWVEASDDDTRLPRVQDARAEDEKGRGLALVSLTASAWGTRPTPTGKVVWARVDL